MTFTHASIVPLIGGETIGAERAFGRRPEFMMSYKAFAANDSHIVHHYSNDVPYYVLDDGGNPHTNVDVISSVCPCAGLSQLSHGFGDHNENNKWLRITTEYVLGELKPKVLYGENAPGFAGKIGENVRNELKTIGKKNGYTMSVYRTKTLLHGGPQIRERSFYFFWRGSRVPLFHYYNRPYTRIEDVLSNVSSNFQMECINKNTPSKWDLYYKFVLDHIHGGITHAEFSKIVEPQNVRNSDIFSYIERAGYDYKQVGKWMAEQGYEKEVAKCDYRYEKLKNGGNIMRRGSIIPKDYIGAFVGHYPTMLTHPVEDRYITYREAMTIMGLPSNFELLNPKKSANHICQNVPVQTATDIATEVLEYLNGNRVMIDTDYVLQYNHTQKAEYATKQNTLESFI
jgi:site-specific DNA-cytosine methylase